MSKVINIDTYSDGWYLLTEENESEPPTEKPTPEVRPVLGWEPGLGDIPLKVNPGYYYGPLRYSNDTVVSNEYIESENRVVPGQHIVPLHRRHDWQRQIETLNNYFLLGKFIQKHVGFCDRGEEPPGGRIPYTDNPIPWACSIICGHNRRNGKRIFQDKQGRLIVELEAQDWNESPNPLITYESDPHLVTTQVLYAPGSGMWRTATGALDFPFVSDVPLVLFMNQVSLYPQVPFECLLHGYSVEISKLFFSGSYTWVLVSGGSLDDGWYQADGYPEPLGYPEPGKSDRYFCNVSGIGWPYTTPPPAGWKNGE